MQLVRGGFAVATICFGSSPIFMGYRGAISVSSCLGFCLPLSHSAVMPIMASAASYFGLFHADGRIMSFSEPPQHKVSGRSAATV